MKTAPALRFTPLSINIICVSQFNDFEKAGSSQRIHSDAAGPFFMPVNIDESHIMDYNMSKEYIFL